MGWLEEMIYYMFASEGIGDCTIVIMFWHLTLSYLPDVTSQDSSSRMTRLGRIGQKLLLSIFSDAIYSHSALASDESRPFYYWTGMEDPGETWVEGVIRRQVCLMAMMLHLMKSAKNLTDYHQETDWDYAATLHCLLWQAKWFNIWLSFLK